MIFIYLIILLIVLLIIEYYKKITYFSKRGLPLSYAIFPFIGNFDTFIEDPTKLFLKRREKFGKIYGFWLGNSPCIAIGSPTIAKQILQKEFQNFTDARIVKLNARYIKDSFLFKKGDEWKKSRALVSPIFTTSKIKDLFIHIQKASQPFFSNVENLIEEGKKDEIDIKELIKGYSLDVIAKLVFALELNSAKENHPFVITVRKILVNTGLDWRIILLSILPEKISELIGLEFMDGKNLEYVANTVRKLINERIANRNQKFNDLVDMLLETFEEKKIEIKEDEIIGTCLVFLLAGMETTASNVSNILYLLALHPNYQDQLYDDLINLYQNKEINYDNLNDSKLLDAIIKESQRMIPIASMIFRIAENSINIDDLKVNSGDIFGIDLYSLMNSEDYWENPNIFKPERFLDKENIFKFDNVIDNEDKKGVLFLPFGAGPRACIATRMATVQIKYIIGRIIMNYKVYRTEKTDVPPKFTKNAMQLTYDQMIIGFDKR